MNFDIKKPISVASLGETKQLFYSSFQNGFNTYYDWAVLSTRIGGTGESPFFQGPSKNSSYNGGQYSYGSALSADNLNITIESTADNNDLFAANTYSYMKLPRNGLTFLCVSIAQASVAQPQNTSQFSVKLRYGSQVQRVSRSNWNIDGMGDSGSTKNPSGKSLDFTEPQTASLICVNGGDGGLLLSFLVDGIFYPAHFIAANNIASDSQELSTRNIMNYDLPVGFQAKKQTSASTLDIGYIGSDSEFCFEIERTYNVGESETTSYNIYFTDCFTTGDNVNINQFPFTANSVDITNNFSYSEVTSSATTLLQLMMDSFAGNLYRDSGTFTVDDIEVSVISSDLAQACLVEIGYNLHVGSTTPSSYITVGNSTDLVKSLPTSTPDVTTTPIFTDTMLVNSGTSKKITPTKLNLQKFPIQLGIVVIQWGDDRYFLRKNLVVRIRAANPFSSTATSMYASAVVNGYEQK